MLSSSTRPDAGEREVFVAVVAPVGGPVDSTLTALRRSFEGHGYQVEDVRISALLDTAVATPSEDAATSRLWRLMNKGDAFRVRLSDDAACAYLASQAIARSREAATGSKRVHRPKHVNLIRSLKTAGEVKLLRSIYGERLIVIGVGASKRERRTELTRQLLAEPDVKEVESEVARLLARDEKDDADKYGQRASDAYRLSDAFVAAKRLNDAAVVERLVELILGQPFSTPDRDEYGMFHAWASKLRSSAAGRQVGAAIVDADGEIVVSGCNDVPRPGGGQYWPKDTDDARDFQLGHDANDRGKFGMARDVLQQLANAGWLSDEVVAQSPTDRARAALMSDGPLRASQMDDLIEYGRIVHAEMAALMTAARTGRPVRGCTLYTTTYPCHECARLIIAAGISRVVFIDPYLKSRAPELFEGMFDDETPGPVLVEAFQGVSPRLFARVFEMSNRAKDVEGTYAAWGEKELMVENEEIVDSIPYQEDAAGAYLAVRLAETAEEALEVAPSGTDMANGDAARDVVTSAPDPPSG